MRGKDQNPDKAKALQEKELSNEEGNLLRANLTTIKATYCRTK